MNQGKISVRYAKAIFMLAKEKNILDKVYKDFKLIRETIQEASEFDLIISSPTVSSADKLNIFTKVYKDSVHEITMRFLSLLVDKNREIHLEDIARYFETIYRKENNIKQVIVTTTHPISNDIAQNISNLVATGFASTVEIKSAIKDDMIGGIILRIDNQQLDLSVKTQLQEIKKKLKSKT
ncbi:MAG: ATP synthase F1 subunit delta [Bacteroidales bacterium]|nr:ATP synthase F1 subunit delta [Bacteroidales bacterium]MDY0140335.1 ATP synthase F1 subunit delta [Bacteroidales bacterium]